MEVSLDVAELIVLHGDWIPLDLLILQRVSKSFYRTIKRLRPDYGIEENMKLLHRDLTEAYLERILKSNMVIFGSTLLCAVLGRLDVKVSDIDVFSPSSNIKTIRRVFPTANKTLTGNNYIEAFEHWRVGFFDIPAASPRRGESIEECIQRHISTSDLSIQRITYGRNGFKCERLLNFCSPVQVCMDLCRSVYRLEAFLQRFPEYQVVTYVPLSSNDELRGILRYFPDVELSFHDQDTLCATVKAEEPYGFN